MDGRMEGWMDGWMDVCDDYFKIEKWNAREEGGGCGE
jgi:hypothetical protein